MDAYVPVYSEGGKEWFPSNEAATELVQMAHAWRDIAKLNEIRLAAAKSDPIADRLLLKFMLVEFFSALDHARRLQGLIRTSPKLIAGKPAPFRYITRKDLERVTGAYRGLWVELAPLEPLIANIRNNIGAHRSAEIGGEIEALWNNLDPNRFIRLINQIPSVFKIVEELNIYNWSCMDGESGAMSSFGARITHDWEDAFSEEEIEPVAPPNGGPAEPLNNSEARGEPPSVS